MVAKLFSFVTNTENNTCITMNADELYVDDNELEEDDDVFDPDDYDLDEKDEL